MAADYQLIKLTPLSLSLSLSLFFFFFFFVLVNLLINSFVFRSVIDGALHSRPQSHWLFNLQVIEFSPIS